MPSDRWLTSVPSGRFSMRSNVGVQVEGDALRHGDVEQPLANLLLIAAQDGARAVQDGDGHPQLVEDARELIGDVAAAGDQHAPGEFGQVEHLVGGDAVFAAGAVRHQGARAGGDQDVLGRHRAAGGEADLVRPGDLRALMDDLDARVAQRLLVEAVQPVDLGQHVVAERGPGEAGGRHRPAEAARVVQILREVRAVDQQLLGHAAPDDAGAADPELLRHRHARAVRGGDAAGAHPAGAGADGEQVVVVSHGSLGSLRRGAP